ncbi:MAG: hypothetical protein M3N13_01375 [Candidatus Eremiobacteraeota bacterium]|nr:hypothetical protein [Candidatus Eremiobacteraeota bacterium]
MDEFASLVLSLPGVWEGERLEELHELLMPAYEREIFVLDLRETVFLGDAILDAFMEMESYRSVTMRCHPTRVVVTSRHLKCVLQLASLDQTFEIYATLPEALLASFKIAEQEAR